MSDAKKSGDSTTLVNFLLCYDHTYLAVHTGTSRKAQKVHK